MAEENPPDECVVEVFGIHEEIEDELLMLYFENRRRSGGGSLRSFTRCGSGAVLVYESPAVAQAVLQKAEHVLQGHVLSVRRAPPKDPGKLVLRGLKPQMTSETLELYIENISGLECGQYTVHFSPGRDLALIQLLRPLSPEEFQRLVAKVARRHLDGASVMVQQISQTDTVVVENLSPTCSEDILSLYFENRRSGGGPVKEVTMLPGGRALVSFQDPEVVQRVLQRQHKLDGQDLVTEPYYDFLLPPESSAERSEGGDDDGGSGGGGGSSEIFSSCVSILESEKAHLLQSSGLLEELQAEFPGCSSELQENEVQLSGHCQLAMEQMKNRILEFFSSIAQVHIPFAPDVARFFVRSDVREHVQGLFDQAKVMASYAVLDSILTIHVLSPKMVTLASSLVKSAVVQFTVPLADEHLHALATEEWQALLSSLKACAVSVSNSGDQVSAVTLKEFREENEKKLQDFFLDSVIHESVITMEPGMLRYLQENCHELLAGIGQVSIFPLDGGDVTGFRISGDARACQATDEFLRCIMASVSSRTVTLDYPGVARFLRGDHARSLLKELEAKFKCVICTERLCWTPPLDSEVGLDAVNNQTVPNFERNPPNNLNALPENSVMRVTDANANTMNPPDLELIKNLIAVIDVDEDSSVSAEANSSGQENTVVSRGIANNLNNNMEEEDLYTDQILSPLDASGALGNDAVGGSQDGEETLREVEGEDGEDGLLEDAAADTADPDLKYAEKLSLASLRATKNIEEDAELYLALQYSMETSNQRLTEEEELQKVLELSRKMIEEEQEGKLAYAVQASTLDQADTELEEALGVSMQDAVEAANSARLVIYAGFDSDLNAIADELERAIKSKVHEERLENECLWDLSEAYTGYMVRLERKHAVCIAVRRGVAIIRGFLDYPIHAICDINKLVTRILQDEKLKLMEAGISNTVCWVWYDQQEQARPYPTKANVFLEHAWRQKQKQVDVLFDGKPHTIDFERLEEYSIGSGVSLKIERQEQKRETVNGTAESDALNVAGGTQESVNVDETSEEFREIVKDFYDTLEDQHNKIRIIKLEKLVHPLLYKQYQLKKAKMEKDCSTITVERTLYHGTSEEGSKEICLHGFNRSFCGKNATLYGQGVYFAEKAVISVQDQYSPANAQGHKFVFVVKTLTGDYTKGTTKMKVPPLKENCDRPLRYDSLVDNPTDPSIFVIFNDTQAYPQYLITCNRI
ncbi:protein mono-ADP-ribosyltransferase PARP10 [Latimeria chalumnae]|uniref:protein mono-ADP-ribosyltransferase PARP10 n=1 Tax=Latimeria chalumnae TaxID=7897 RepID=UPI0006D8DB6E|nr:PREDICTED: poly [ADP-ribose] polymerase 10 [Latimeria chalumnae]|eukprot:XP_014352077.1 PREDICTED: poly [ADP-ribose] polymerase 10 [Latimeria chalumnae]